MAHDPDQPLIEPGWGPDGLEGTLRSMILSASGWRAIFAADGDEESFTADVAPDHLVVAGLAASVFADHLGPRSVIAIGTDTRPTGPLLAHAAISILDAAGIGVRYLGVSASPEIMAYARADPNVDGFFYLSASHNPVGHNGIKMGGADGGVVDRATAATLIERFRTLAADQARVEQMVEPLRHPATAATRDLLAAREPCKKAALDYYGAHTKATAAGPGRLAKRAMESFARQVSIDRPGLVIDFNGSARAVSIDVDYLQDLGCELRLMNNKPGEISHVIVPEGDGLEPCREMLERCATRSDRFVMGYVPDNDGDRGNLVAVAGSAVRMLEAQEVFALACVAELCWLEYTGVVDGNGTPVAIAVNGPTSLRVERIAAAFGATVARSEVGEANVVNLARELRASGNIVRILGEGSNGGNITHPSAVRDPLQTVLAILKLILSPPLGKTSSPLEIWANRSGVRRDAALDATPAARLGWLIDSLPRFTTTSAFSQAARLRIRTTNHAALKGEFERRLPEAIGAVMPRLESELGVTRCEIANYEGTAVRQGPGNRTGSERGGLKVRFLDGKGVERAYAWMRGSGTEPVFRVMVDVEGSRVGLHDTLLEWLRALVMQADGSV